MNAIQVKFFRLEEVGSHLIESLEKICPLYD